MDRLVPKPMATAQLNALGTTRSTFVSCWLADSKFSPNIETLHLFSTEQYSFFKTNKVAKSLLIISISAVLVAVAWAETSPTPSRIVSHIPRQSVQSSVIAKVGYSKRHHILEIEFVNGAVYRYFDIPISVHRDLMSAESKARFYDSNIRKHYHSVLVRPRQREQH